MSTTTRELKVVHFVDELLSRSNTFGVDPVELAEVLLKGDPGRGRASPSKKVRGPFAATNLVPTNSLLFGLD
jgi:hypothetical protein